MADFPEGDVEFERAWSSAAGELHGFKTCVAEIERRSAAAFVARRDEVANALRDAATYLNNEIRKKDETLQEYIKESHRRNHEKRKMLR